MSKHNYSQYSNKKKNKPQAEVVDSVTTIAATDEIPVEVKMEPVEPVVVMVPIEVVEPVAATKTTTGTVAHCNKLNVRSKPAMHADVLTILDAGAVVTIDIAKSNSDWLKISTAEGVNGYCVRKFVDVKL